MPVAPPSTPEDLARMAQGLPAAAVLKAALELGVPAALAQGPLDAASVSNAVGTDERATRVLLEAMAALGLAHQDGDLFRLTQATQAHLVPGRPVDLGPALGVALHDALWARYGGLAAAVRRGGAAPTDSADSAGHPWWAGFARAGQPSPVAAIDALDAAIAPSTAGTAGSSVLDVGCGTGAYGIGLARRHAGWRVLGIDGPDVVAVAKREAVRAGVEDRVTFRAGDPSTMPWGGPHDVVLLSFVLHLLPPQAQGALLEKAVAGLRPGGTLAIHEVLSGDGPPTEDPGPRMFSLMLLVLTGAGEVRPLAHYERAIAQAGLVSLRVVRYGAGPAAWLLGERPAP